MLLLSESRIESLAIDLADSSDVLRRFQTALDLKTNNSASNQSRDLRNRREILRGEKIAFIAQIPHRTVHH
jgi:hypothetical protein